MQIQCSPGMDIDYLAGIIDGTLQESGVSMRKKNVQDMDTRSDLALVSIHNAICLKGLKTLLMDLAVKMEKSMIKSGKHKVYKGLPFPEFVLQWRNLQEPQSNNNKDKLELSQSNRHLKNAVHIELATKSHDRLKPVMRNLGPEIIPKYLGATAGIIGIGYGQPRSEENV